MGIKCHPADGWVWTEALDLLEETGKSRAVAPCPVCHEEKSRFIHILTHPAFSESLRAGRKCAEKLTGDSAGIKAREERLKIQSSLRRSWLKRKWRLSAKGNPYIIIDGLNLGIFRQSGRWSARIDGVFSEKTFSTEQEAKLELLRAYLKKLE